MQRPMPLLENEINSFVKEPNAEDTAQKRAQTTDLTVSRDAHLNMPHASWRINADKEGPISTRHCRRRRVKPRVGNMASKRGYLGVIGRPQQREGDGPVRGGVRAAKGWRESEGGMSGCRHRADVRAHLRHYVFSLGVRNGKSQQPGERARHGEGSWLADFYDCDKRVAAAVGRGRGSSHHGYHLSERACLRA